MKMSRDDLFTKTTGELTRLFSAAKADTLRQPPASEARRRAWDTVQMIRAELSRRQP